MRIRGVWKWAVFFVALLLGVAAAQVEVKLDMPEDSDTEESVESPTVLETDFYKVEIPPGWEVRRNLRGLWEVTTPDEGSFERANLAVSRLSTRADLYLQGTARLWAARGELSVLEEASDSEQRRIVFLVKPKPLEGEVVVAGEEMVELKIAHWNEELMVISSLMFPVKHLETALDQGISFTGNIELKPVLYEIGSLETFVRESLENHRNDPEELSDFEQVKTEMTSFRQDWGPYFPHFKPDTFEAYRAYLEARFDAAFVIANGEELGMPESLLDARLTSIQNRKDELLLTLE